MKSLINGFIKGFKDYGYGINLIVNTVLLSLIYFLGIGTVNLVARLKGKHFLDMKKERKTYWKEVNRSQNTMEKYRRQF